MSELAFKVEEKLVNEKAKAIRKKGQTPGVIYGEALENPISIKIANTQLPKIFKTHLTSSVVPLEVNNDVKNCVIKDIQKDMYGKVIHVDFQYVKANDMEQISHGVYATKNTWTDVMYLVHLRCKQAVFSHETALFLHDLTDREPLEYEITVKTGYNPSKLKDDGIKVYTIKKELHGEGITTMQTSFGHLVPVYNMERTICDIIRNRNNTEIQTFQTALKQYAKRKDKNLRLLMQYAAEFHVDKILRQYFEVLL